MKTRPVVTLLVMAAIIVSTLFLIAPQGSPSAFASQARAPLENEICYAVADNESGEDALSRVEYVSGLHTVVGLTGTFSIEAMTFQKSTGILFAANLGQLGVLDPTTGVFSTGGRQPMGTGGGGKGEVAFTDADGLTFDPITGILYATHRTRPADQEDLLFQVNPVTGAHVPDAFGPGVDYVMVGAINGFRDVDDITVDPITGQMYGIGNNGGVGDLLIKIDKTNGTVMEVGLLGVDDMEGLTHDPFGQMLGTTGKDGPAATRDRLYRIDKVTGVADLANSKPLVAGGHADYEAVDCLSSPNVPTETPTPTATATDTPTPTPTPTQTPTPTPTQPTAVQLLYFRVDKVIGQQVNLSWATGSEIDTFGFKLYRSADSSFANAQKVASVAARSPRGGTYSYADTTPQQGEWWYWLVEVDTQGREHILRGANTSQGGLTSGSGKIFMPLMLKPGP